MKVEVYRNLHNRKFSVRDAKTKQVICHADNVTLSGVTFHVSQAGRERVVREQRKNVHAVVRGNLASISHPQSYKDRDITTYFDGSHGEDPVFAETGTYACYNPYKYKHFMTVRNNGLEVIDDAPAVRIDSRGIELGYI